VAVRQWFFPRYLYYALALSILVVLLLWRCLGHEWSGSQAALAVGFALPGLALVIFGAGAHVMMNASHPVVGSVVDVQLMLGDKRTPAVLYFNDGYVALDLTVTHKHCRHKAYKNVNVNQYAVHAGQCYHYSMAPVFANAQQAARGVNATVFAWAIPRGFGALTFEGTAKSIPADTCRTTAGVGLCGVTETHEVFEHAYKKESELYELFKKHNPYKNVTGSAPFILFVDPHYETAMLTHCWVFGLFLVLGSLAITGLEVKRLCEEVDDPRACWLQHEGRRRIARYDMPESDSDGANDLLPES